MTKDQGDDDGGVSVRLAVIALDGKELTEREKRIVNLATQAGASACIQYAEITHEFADASEREVAMAVGAFATTLGVTISKTFGDHAPGLLRNVARAAIAADLGPEAMRDICDGADDNGSRH